jgi:hypothetical protein
VNVSNNLSQQLLIISTLASDIHFCSFLISLMLPLSMLPCSIKHNEFFGTEFAGKSLLYYTIILLSSPVVDMLQDIGWLPCNIKAKKRTQTWQTLSDTYRMQKFLVSKKRWFVLEHSSKIFLCLL